MMVPMSVPARPRRRASTAWAAAILAGIVAAGGWVLLGLALRAECDDAPSCDDWVLADAAATGVALAALAIWAARGRRAPAWLAVATAALAVPLYHVAFA